MQVNFANRKKLPKEQANKISSTTRTRLSQQSMNIWISKSVWLVVKGSQSQVGFPRAQYWGRS